MSEIEFVTREWRFTLQNRTFLDEKCLGGLGWKQKMKIKRSPPRAATISGRFDFEWDENVFDGFKGNIHVELTYFGQWREIHSVPVVLDKMNTRVNVQHSLKKAKFRYRLNLTPSAADLNKLESRFEPSDVTDAVLLVDGKKMHVNRGFLAFHSQFFRSLFQSEFKEKSMDEIPIGDVKFVDFARLLLSVYPDPDPLSEESAVPVLELADRFMMPAVIRLLEPILVKTSTFSVSRKLLLAENLRLDNLWKTTVATLKRASEMKEVVKSSEYKEFPDSLKAKLFEHYFLQ